MAKEDNPRWQMNQKKAATCYMTRTVKNFSKLVNIKTCVFEAILIIYEDPTLIALGEENRDWGGAFLVACAHESSSLSLVFFNAPISEEQIVASAIGYGMAGGRAIPELMYTIAWKARRDAVFNQLPSGRACAAFSRWQ